MAKVDWKQDDYDKSSGLEVMPKGRYLCVISDSEDVKTKDRTGRYFQFEFIVVAPKDYKNRKLWARFNVHNASETAQRIGREQFNALADACDMMGKVTDTKNLHDKNVVCIVGVKPADGQYKETNEILGFQKYEGPQASAQPAGGNGAAKRQDPPKAQPPAPKKPVKIDDMEDDIPF